MQARIAAISENASTRLHASFAIDLPSGRVCNEHVDLVLGNHRTAKAVALKDATRAGSERKRPNTPAQGILVRTIRRREPLCIDVTPRACFDPQASTRLFATFEREAHDLFGDASFKRWTIATHGV